MESLIGWLEALRYYQLNADRTGTGLEYGEDGVVIGNYYDGNILNVCQASVDLCKIQESLALEIERTAEVQIPQTPVTPGTSAESPRPEIVSVLFMDLVGYSRLPTDEQPKILQRLQTTVRETAQYRRALQHAELIPIPTGDGMALVFTRDPIEPVECALEIAQSLQRNPEIKLRMGINTGPVYRHSDIKGEPNVVGNGINVAQRVMDFGDAGHILLSRNVAEVLEQLSGWIDCLQDLGVHKTKHEANVHLYSLSKGALGNRQTPSRVASSPAERISGQAEQQLDTSLIALAPRFIVSYRKTTDWERLSFLNEGKRAAINTKPGALVHKELSTNRVHEITMTPAAIPTILSGATGEGKIMAEESPGHGTKLIDIIRKGAPDSIDTVVLTFEDGERHKFEQQFELTRQTDDSIRWDPGPVRLQEQAPTNQPANEHVDLGNGRYYRQIRLRSVTDLQKNGNELWRALTESVLQTADWPLSVFLYQQAGESQYLSLEMLAGGLRLKFRQKDVLVDRYESLEAFADGRVSILETQEFPDRYRNGGVPYNTVIETTADALRFCSQFFTKLGLGDANEVAVTMEWGGLKDRFITFDSPDTPFPSLRADLSAKICRTDNPVSSPELKFKLLDANRDLAGKVRYLLGDLFSQFNFFDPRPAVYEQIIEHWRLKSAG